MSNPSADVKTVQRLLQTPEGDALLRYLRVHYDADAIMDVSNPNLTHFRLGQRDVYRDLLYQSERGNQPDE